MSIFAIKGTRKQRAAFIANKNLRKRTRLKCGLLQQVRGKLFKGHAYISRRRCSCTSRPRKNMRAFAHAPVSRHRNVPVRVYCLCRRCLYLCASPIGVQTVSIRKIYTKFLLLRLYRE